MVVAYESFMEILHSRVKRHSSSTCRRCGRTSCSTRCGIPIGRITTLWDIGCCSGSDPGTEKSNEQWPMCIATALASMISGLSYTLTINNEQLKLLLQFSSSIWAWLIRASLCTFWGHPWTVGNSPAHLQSGRLRMEIGLKCKSAKI